MHLVAFTFYMIFTIYMTFAFCIALLLLWGWVMDGYGPGQELACIPVQVATPSDSKNTFSQMVPVLLQTSEMLKCESLCPQNVLVVCCVFVGTTEVEKCFPESKGSQAGEGC